MNSRQASKKSSIVSDFALLFLLLPSLAVVGIVLSYLHETFEFLQLFNRLAQVLGG